MWFPHGFDYPYVYYIYIFIYTYMFIFHLHTVYILYNIYLSTPGQNCCESVSPKTSPVVQVRPCQWGRTMPCGRCRRFWIMWGKLRSWMVHRCEPCMYAYWLTVIIHILESLGMLGKCFHTTGCYSLISFEFYKHGMYFMYWNACATFLG